MDGPRRGGCGLTTAVGLDLSLTSSGLARITWSLDRVVAETWRRGEDGVTLLDVPGRNRAVRHLAADVLAYADHCDLVVIEGPSMNSRSTSDHERAYLWWSVVDRLLRREVPLVVVTPHQRAKWATGKGNDGKTAVAIAAGRMWPEVTIRDDNEADALVLATIGMQILDGPLPCEATAYRQAVVDGLNVIEEEAA